MTAWCVWVRVDRRREADLRRAEAEWQQRGRPVTPPRGAPAAAIGPPATVAGSSEPCEPAWTTAPGADCPVCLEPVGGFSAGRCCPICRAKVQAQVGRIFQPSC
eukprot:gene31452-55067_t